MIPIKTHDMLTGNFGRPPPKPYKTDIPIYDDEDEWEYEYSTSETDTYYLTLDLSIPEFTTRDSRNVVQAGRGGYLTSWIGDPEKPGLSQKKRYRFAADDMDDMDDDNELPEREDQDPDDVPIASVATAHKTTHNSKDAGVVPKAPAAVKTASEPEPSEHKAGEPVESVQQQAQQFEAPDFVRANAIDAAEVQILELHSTTPIFAYRGRIFEGTWAENTGTELIFAAHDPAVAAASPAALPRIATLPGNVALLAASSARILTTERKIQPRMDTNLADVKTQHGIRVVPGRDLNGERRKQATFLENLMAVKKIRGEPDAVPVFARPPQNKLFKDDRDPDWKPRRRKVRVAEAPPRPGRTATVTEVSGAAATRPATATDASATTTTTAAPSQQPQTQRRPAAAAAAVEEEEEEEEGPREMVFQPPWQPPLASGAVPFFSTPQFRPRRKKQQLPGAAGTEQRRAPVAKTNLPVSKSARTALLSEDHGVSVSAMGKSTTSSSTSTAEAEKGNANADDEDEDMGGV